MNLLNKNKVGLTWYEKGFPYLKRLGDEAKKLMIKKNSVLSPSVITEDSFMIHPESFDFKCQKVIRISESIYHLSKTINIESIYNNIESLDLKFTDIAILMPSDFIGIVSIKKVGGDIVFLWIQDLKNAEDFKYSFNIYNFLTKNFTLKKTEDSEFILKILTYLFYGEIEEKLFKPNTKINFNSFEYIKNESKKDIWYADSLWKTKISLVGDFKVRGHFRLQPCGENRINKKLIFIEEFLKHGYSRNATVENFNNSKPT